MILQARKPASDQRLRHTVAAHGRRFPARFTVRF